MQWAKRGEEQNLNVREALSNDHFLERVNKHMLDEEIDGQQKDDPLDEMQLL